MIVERSMNPQFLSNAYLVADGKGGPSFLVDAGAPVQPLIEAADGLGAEPTHVLLTHHHFDHVSELEALRARWPAITALIHPLERQLLQRDGHAEPPATPLGVVQAGDSLRFGALEVRPLNTPGHTAGMLSFLVFEPGAAARRPARFAGPGGFEGGDAVVFTGDTLFKGSVGGVRAPGHTTCIDLRDSIMGTLMELPPQTVIYPGHTDSTTVHAEWQSNPFIRVWRGVDAEGTRECVALGGPATLVLLARDYDGGTKAWVRWPDGAEDIVPGSRVQVAGQP